MLKTELLNKLNNIIIEEKNIDVIMENIWKYSVDNNIIIKVEKIDTYVRKCIYSIKLYLLSSNINRRNYFILREIIDYLENIQNSYYKYTMCIMLRENGSINMHQIVDNINTIEEKFKLLKI